MFVHLEASVFQYIYIYYTSIFLFCFCRVIVVGDKNEENREQTKRNQTKNQKTVHETQVLDFCENKHTHSIINAEEKRKRSRREIPKKRHQGDEVRVWLWFRNHQEQPRRFMRFRVSPPHPNYFNHHHPTPICLFLLFWLLVLSIHDTKGTKGIRKQNFIGMRKHNSEVKKANSQRFGWFNQGGDNKEHPRNIIIYNER